MVYREVCHAVNWCRSRKFMTGLCRIDRRMITVYPSDTKASIIIAKAALEWKETIFYIVLHLTQKTLTQRVSFFLSSREFFLCVSCLYSLFTLSLLSLSLLMSYSSPSRFLPSNSHLLNKWESEKEKSTLIAVMSSARPALVESVRVAHNAKKR